MQIIAVEQTIFVVRHLGKACNQIALEVQSDREETVQITLEYAQTTQRESLLLLPGSHSYHLYAQASEQPYQLRLTLHANQGDVQASLDVLPRKHWDISFVPLSHHDYGYTEVIDRLKGQYHQYYEDVLRFCEMTEGYPEQAQYRYTVECGWSVLSWLDSCTQSSRSKFLHYARIGRIDIMAFTAHVVDTSCSTEELIRLMFPAFELKRKYGIQIESASFVDMPGLSWGVPKVLHDAGVRYFFAGMPTYFEWEDCNGVHDMGKTHTFWEEKAVLPNGRPGAFYWKGQDESSVLAYYQGSYGWFLGALPEDPVSPHSYEDIERNLPAIIRDVESRGIAHDCLRFIDHGVDNYPPQITISDTVRRWNEKYVSPQLRVDTNTGFFCRLQNCGLQFPTFSGELPHTDYNMAAMSFAKEQTMNYVNHSQVQSAETLATMQSLLAGGRNRQAEVASIYNDIIMFDEHCFGMSRPFGRVYDWNWSSKSHHVYRACATSDEIVSESAYAMAGQVSADKGTQLVVVFNPSSTVGSDLVTVANFPWEEGEYILTDAVTGVQLAAQMHKIDDPYLPVPFAPYRYSMYRMGNPERCYAMELQFVAHDVPAYGYKSYYAVRKPTALPEKPKRLMIENEFYRVEVDAHRGVLSSLWDKQLDREMVDQTADYGFGQVVVRDAVSEAVLPYLTASASIRRYGPVVKSILIQASTAVCPQLAVELLLYEGLKKLDVSIRLLKDYAPLYEAFAAFPFAVADPQLRYDGSACIARPFDDQFPGSNTNYYSVQDWAMANNNEVSAMLAPSEAHIVEFGGIWPSYVSQAHHGVHPTGFGVPFVEREQIRVGHMYALLLYNNSRTNFNVAQTGDILYRFSIVTGDGQMPYGNFRQTDARGLVPALATASGDGKLPSAQGLLRIEEENVRVTACKLAEEDGELVVRLEERQGLAGMATITVCGFVPAAAQLLSAVEEPLSTLCVTGRTIQLPIKAYQMKTLRIFRAEPDVSRYQWGLDHTVEFRY